MTPDDRVEAIRAFGYSAREAAFLVTAMLHGGFFVGRQFNQFIGQSTSRAVAHLAAKLGARRHVTVIASRGGPHVYHLRSKQLYAVVSESEARKRHRPSLLTIKTRLMALDYVLSHSDEVFLTTERELAYRACIRGIDEIRRFPAQYRGPIGFRDGSDSEGPRLSFVYLGPAGSSLSGFRRYLDHSRDLLCNLTAGRVVYTSDSTELFERAETAFRRFYDDDREIRARTAAEQMAALLAHFGTRCCYERKQLAGFTKATLDRFRDDRERFRGARFEGAYARWLTEGDEGVRRLFERDPSSLIRPDLRFETHWLNHSYAHCGTRSEIGRQTART